MMKRWIRLLPQALRLFSLNRLTGLCSTTLCVFVLRSANDQKELREARDRAEAGEKFKDSVMSVMSHELRTPLNAIIGFGQLISELFEKNSDNLYKEYSDYIVDGGKRLLNAVSDMLLASDARSGPIKLNETDMSICATH